MRYKSIYETFYLNKREIIFIDNDKASLEYLISLLPIYICRILTKGNWRQSRQIITVNHNILKNRELFQEQWSSCFTMSAEEKAAGKYCHTKDIQQRLLVLLNFIM